MDALDLRIRNHVYARFVETGGEAATPEQAAAELGLAAEETRGAYRRLHDGHALDQERDDPDRIRMLNPFSAVETPHRVEAGGREWFANCAWDALGIPGALHGDGVVRSRCEECGEALELEVVDGALARGADLVAHFVVPARRWWDDIVFT
jgi:hypothetical protein